MTCLRADANDSPNDNIVKYYEQRARTSGTLFITETAPISAGAGGIPMVPPVETQEQLAAWKKVCSHIVPNDRF